jgi:hypothetical protein
MVISDLRGISRLMQAARAVPRDHGVDIAAFVVSQF